MRKKLMRVGLVAACHMLLISGISYASQTNEAHFAFEPYDKVVEDIEDIVNQEFLEEFEELYDTYYTLEKSMQYFAADEKLDDVIDLADEIEGYLTDEGDEALDAADDFIDMIEDLERDYRYGMLGYTEAYPLELEAYMDNVPEANKQVVEAMLKKEYAELEDAYSAYIEDAHDWKKLSNLRHERHDIKRLLEQSQEEDNILKGDFGTYVIPDVFNDPAQLEDFLDENMVQEIIGEGNVTKLQKMLDEAGNADDDIDADELLDDIEEMLLDLFDSKYDGYQGKNRNDIEIINRLYDELDDDDDDEDDE